jgi:hypothetical protein
MDISPRKKTHQNKTHSVFKRSGHGLRQQNASKQKREPGFESIEAGNSSDRFIEQYHDTGESIDSSRDSRRA